MQALLLASAVLLPSAAGLRMYHNGAVFRVPPSATQSTGVIMRVDFSGSWEMDLKASDKLGPVLRELGVPRVLAAVITRLPVQEEISQADDCVQIQISSSVTNTVLQLRFDGSIGLLPGVAGGSTAATTCWLDEDESLLETRQCLSPDAQRPPNDPLCDAFITTRSLLDDGALLEDCLVIRDGRPVPGATARRILRRVTAPGTR